MWLHDPTNNLAMSCLPRCGQHSLREAFLQRNGQYTLYTNEEIVALNPSILIGWIRDPIERIISAYSMFSILNERGEYKARPNSTDCATWESFIDYILDNSNTHWDSQVEQLTYQGIYLPTNSFKFENISTLWANHYGGKIPHMNGYVHLPVTLSYRSAELQAKYAADITLHGSL